MSISVYRLKQVDDKDLNGLGRPEGMVLINHWRHCSDSDTDYIDVSEDELQDDLENAAKCDGECNCFEGGKTVHDEAVAKLRVMLPKLLANSRADGNDGWTTLQINW